MSYRTYVVGIAGSRRRNSLTDRKIVNRLVVWQRGKHYHEPGFAIVSGGCRDSADEFAEDACRLFDHPIDMLVFPIDKKGTTTKWEFTQRAYARNRQIAEKADVLFALVSEDRTGGTENTIQHALDLKKPVYLVFPTGEVYLSPDGKTVCPEPEIRLLDLKYTD